MKFKKIVGCSLLLASGIALASCNKLASASNLVGFDIDFARELSNELGVEVKFQEIVWEQKELELSSKNIDLIWNGLTITDERKENLELSIPYLLNKQVVVSKNIDSLDSEKSYQIAFEAGSAGGDLFNSDSTFKNSKKVETNSQTDALTEVLSGTSDLAIIDSVMAGYYVNSNTSYKSLSILDYDSDSEYYGIAGRKGDKALISKVNEIITNMYQNGKTKEVASKYGLESYLVKPEEYVSSSSDDSLNYILDKKTLVIGYTVFAPIAYFD